MPVASRVMEKIAVVMEIEIVCREQMFSFLAVLMWESEA